MVFALKEVIVLFEEENVDDGQVFLAYMRYKDKLGGKERPIIAMKDSETEIWLAFKVTSRIEKKLNHKYGYLVEDWQEAGFKIPSIIKCNREDIQDLEPKNIIRKVGELTNRDLKGLLIKTVKIREIEYKRDFRKNQEYER